MYKKFTLIVLVWFSATVTEISAQEPDTIPQAPDATRTATDSLSRQLELVTTELATTQSDLRTTREQLEQGQRTILGLQNSVADAERRLTTLTQDLAVKSDSLASAKVSLVESQYSIDTMRIGLSRFLDEIRSRSANEQSLMELVSQKERALSASRGELERIARERAQETQQLQQQEDSIRTANEIIVQTQGDITTLRQEQAKLDREIRRLEQENRGREAERRRLQAKLDGPARLVFWVGVGIALLIGSIMLYLGVALIRCAFKDSAFGETESSVPAHESYQRTNRHIEGQLSYYRALGHIFRQVIAMQVIASGMLLVAIVAFVFIHNHDPVKLIGEDGFWKTIAAVGVPLAFVTAAYNVIEARRVELVKLSCELLQSSNANMAPAESAPDKT